MDAVGSDLTFRPANGAADALAASQIANTALSDLRVKRGRPPCEGPDDDAVPVLTHLMRTDPETFWIAADGDDRPVGYGVGTTRRGLWFCSGLFLLPEYQGRGVGRRLFELAMGEHPMRDDVSALTSSAANPISNKLYAGHGIYPQLPLLSLEGSPAQVAGEAPRAGGDAPYMNTDEPAAGLGGRGASSKTGGLAVEPLTASTAHLADLAAIDAAVTGIDRTVDHRWHLEEVGHRGWLFRRRGRAAGYAYLGGDGADVIIETWPKIESIFLNNVGGKLVAFAINISLLMLLKSLLGSLARHAHIQTLQHPVKLRISQPEFGIFGEYFF